MNVHPRRSKGHLDYTILQAMDDEHLFGKWFKGESWDPWRTFLAALFGLRMTEAQAAFFRECTGRSELPDKPSNECWLIAGRRSGKSATLAFIATYLACFRDYTPYLQIGERATLRVMSADRDQSRVIFRYISAFLSETPLLAKLVSKQTAETIELTNRVTIEIGTASFRSSRGYSFAAILADEISFWWTETSSSNTDAEVLAAVRPGMATIPGAMLLAASSPYARKGELWRAFDRWYGRDNSPLVWRAATRVMNTTVPQDFIDAEILKDPANAGSEYLAEFRTDIEAFVSLDAVRACVDAGVYERPPDHRWRYYCFTDPSGGSGDSFTLAIAHKEGNTVILDLVREIRPPFSPEQATEEFAGIARRYRVTKIFGDRYGGEWPRERFRVHYCNYELIDQTKSALYQALLPIINSAGARLLDHDRMLHQLVSLERHTGRSGKDTIDHPPRMFDDIANAVAGAIYLASTRPSGWSKKTTNPFSGGGSTPPSSTPWDGNPSEGWMRH
jgi:hypothetical protein